MRKNTLAIDRNTSLSPWQNPLSPDPCTNNKAPNTTTTQHTLDHYLTRGRYTAACHKASAGKVLGPDNIPNEILKYLPESAHDRIFQLFQIMAKYSYTSKKCCTSATKLIYKQKKSYPHIPSNCMPIALMNCILKLWAFIGS